MSPQELLREGRFRPAKIALGTVICGAVLAGLYSVQQTPSPGVEKESGWAEPVQIERPAPGPLQAAIDISPALAIPPVTVIPRPAPRAIVSGTRQPPSSTKAKVPERTSSVVPVDVASFEHCMPGCDTRDPMIVGARLDTDTVALPVSVETEKDLPDQQFAPLRRVRNAVGDVVDASSTAIGRGGRAVVEFGRNFW